MQPALAPWIAPPPGHRLPPDLRLGPVKLQVADLTRSVGWYERVLGLRLRHGGASSALLGTVNGIPLVELHEREGASPVPRRGRLGLFHYAILLPDRPALGRFLSHINETGERVGASDHLVSEATYLNDPDGLGIEVYADRPRESWKNDDGRIAMATLPLDIQEVIQAAGTSRWEGMPAGSRMGHVHLHVGDLDQGAAFYHQALGFDQVKLRFPGALFMSAGGYHHHLGTNVWAPDARPAAEGDARLLEWIIDLPGVEHLAAATASLSGAGYAVQGDGSAATVADPWGTTLRLRARG